MKKELDEPVMHDNEHIFKGFFYIVDGVLTEVFVNTSVMDFKKVTKTKEVRKCDFHGRKKEIETIQRKLKLLNI